MLRRCSALPSNNTNINQQQDNGLRAPLSFCKIRVFKPKNKKKLCQLQIVNLFSRCKLLLKEVLLLISIALKILPLQLLNVTHRVLGIYTSWNSLTFIESQKGSIVNTGIISEDSIGKITVMITI